MAHLFTLYTFLAATVIAGCVPVPLEIVDMTYVFDNTTLRWPLSKKFQLEVDINGTQKGGFWLQSESFYTGIHVGTHIDAPCHFGPEHWCVDEIPLDRFFAPAAVVDMTKTDPDAFLLISDLERWEATTGQSLDGTIVLVRSGWGSRWPNKKAFLGTDSDDITQHHFPGISREAAQWLVDNREIYGIGTDFLSLDSGQTRDSIAHRTILPHNIYGLENVANVDKLPIYGAMLTVLPMKIGNASGAPVRIIAKFPKFPQSEF